MSKPFELAVKMQSLGYTVIPGGGGDKGKKPLIEWKTYETKGTTLDQILEWEERLHPKAWGIVTGPNNGTFEIDDDTPGGSQIFNGNKPHVRTPRGGTHRFYKYPSFKVITKAKILPYIDIRGEGGYSQFAGVTPDGEYQLIELPMPDTLPTFDDLPTVLKEALRNTDSKEYKAVVGGTPGEKITQGNQNEWLYKRACSYRGQGDSEEAIFNKLKIDVLRCDQDLTNPFADADLMERVKSACKHPPGADTYQYALTDAGNAELFTSLNGDHLRYDHRRNRWLEWHRHYWREDTDGQVTRLALKSVRQRFHDATNIEDLKARGKVSGWAIGSEQRARLNSLMVIAKSLLPIADGGDRWDCDPWLFCVVNGIIDLRTGELRDGKPEDCITLRSPVTFDPQAQAPRFLSFLNEIFDGDVALIGWIQRYFGYAMTGICREQVCAMGHGQGGNGKGRLSAILRHVFGDYSYDAPFSTFELTQRSNIPNDMAALVGRRLVTSSETNEGTRLNEARLKALNGEDPVTARFLNCEFFTFQPVSHLFLTFNTCPKVGDDSYGFWRKVRLVPFNCQFKDAAEDKDLLIKLVAEASGILNWLVEGCLRWQKEGLSATPESVLTATKEYEVESDPIAQFILDARCVLSPKRESRAVEIYHLYTSWATEQGMKDREILTATAFGRRMAKKFKKLHKSTGTVYQGIGIGVTGSVTGIEATDIKNKLPGYIETSRGLELEMTSQPVIPSLLNGEITNKKEPVFKCYACGSGEYWYRADGGRVCYICHPPVEDGPNFNKSQLPVADLPSALKADTGMDTLQGSGGSTYKTTSHTTSNRTSKSEVN